MTCGGGGYRFADGAEGGAGDGACCAGPDVVWADAPCVENARAIADAKKTPYIFVGLILISGITSFQIAGRPNQTQP